MKKMSLVLSILFTGCIEPLTPEKFNSSLSDKKIANAYWDYFDKTKKDYN